MRPDWQCGQCGNTLATKVMIEPGVTDGGRKVRWLPAVTGGEINVLSVSTPAGEYIQSEGGPMLVKCAACGSFNELVPAEE
jgi:hypothetical protein